MDEKDIQLVRRIAKETVAEVLDEEVYPSLFGFVDAIEAGVAAFKHSLGVKKGVLEPKTLWLWNPDKIVWEKSQGAKGEFEKSEDVNNPEFKAMLKDLTAHKGKLTRDGLFYWIFKNGSTVGRKKLNKEA
ncbi:MAG: hypothetical protein QXX79_05820 [Candidatus Bathyarchaeia archaeon]